MSVSVRDFVLDDYQETFWHDGNLPCPPPEELAPYFDEFLTDCRIMGREVPEGLTVENYYRTWMEEYSLRTSEEVKA